MILLILLPILIFALSYWSTYPPSLKYFKGLSGPPQKWIFGNALELATNTVEMFATLLKWYEQYSSPMLVKLGPFCGVHIFKASDMETMLKDTVNIKKNRDYKFVWPWLKDGLLTNTGAKWHERRKLLTPAFHFQVLKDFVPVFNREVQQMIQILKEQHLIDTGKAFNISPFITLCTLDIICETAMGIQLNAQRQHNSEYVNNLSRMGEILAMQSFKPWLWWPFLFNLLPIGREFRNVVDGLHQFTESVIQKRENEIDSQKVTETSSEGKRKSAFLDLLLQMKQKGQITLDGVREETDTFMFEGHDTTSTGLMWAIYLIGSHPEVQQKLVEEIEGVCGADVNEAISYEQAASLHYLEQVIKESQRLIPSVPIVMRELVEPLEFDGHIIPSGTSIFISIIGLHRNPEYFPDPLKFDPDRFSSENSDGRHPFAFVPFSGGLRNCIGQKFAMLEERVVLAQLIRNFHIESVQKFEDLKPCNEIVLRPSNGIRVKLNTRQC